MRWLQGEREIVHGLQIEKKFVWVEASTEVMVQKKLTHSCYDIAIVDQRQIIVSVLISFSKVKSSSFVSM